MTGKRSTGPKSAVREIRRKTQRKFLADEKIRMVLEGLRGGSSIAELCRREGSGPNLYYRWSKDFVEAGKKRLQGDTVREAPGNICLRRPYCHVVMMSDGNARTETQSGICG
jgi:transposase